jgi:hypothetical protein
MHIVPPYYKLGNLCIRKVGYQCLDYLRITKVGYLRITKVGYLRITKVVYLRITKVDYLRITKVGYLRITKNKEPQTDKQIENFQFPGKITTVTYLPHNEGKMNIVIIDDTYHNTRRRRK